MNILSINYSYVRERIYPDVSPNINLPLLLERKFHLIPKLDQLKVGLID